MAQQRERLAQKVFLVIAQILMRNDRRRVIEQRRLRIRRAQQCLQAGKPAAFARAADAPIYQRRSNSAPSVRLLRDAMWKFSRWYTPQLRRWLDQEKPTCIFLAPGYAKLIYDIALKKTGLKTQGKNC